ncbi:MAG TPA: PHB depolymerase family esterase [Burkholderiaceae bacterium]|nr:PHB depolymerase family esterase [Burkholderiaceae bacterium]
MSFRTLSDTIARALGFTGLLWRWGRVKGVTGALRTALAKVGIAPGSAPRTTPRRAAATPTDAVRFLSRSFTNAAGTRAYKLYVPASYRGTAVPLLMMLHGCKQNPDDFAAGTRMNELAEAHGFLVAYPAQSERANGANCWNWFRSGDQARDGGEPSILAGIVAAIAADYAIDRRRVFVAGLSAGAAMAVILGRTHPEVFTAVGAHSGLPYRAAQGVASAFAAMHGGLAQAIAGWPPLRAADAAARAAAVPAVPTIVFHGDHDPTVAASNSDAIVAQALAAPQASALLESRRLEPASAVSRGHTNTAYTTPDGRTLVEQWTLHGGAHAWSGGSPEGSYTEAQGPDASAEMVRFFLAQ